MKYRVYTNINISLTPYKVFPTYFQTKKAAMVYAESLKNNSKVSEIYIERKGVGSWVAC